MSKDLEKEYKELIDSDAPDLWTRIEAGIDEKNVSGYKKKALKRFHYGVWGTALAACLCVAVAVPVMMQVSKGQINDMTAAPEAEKFDADDMADNAAMSDNADGMSDNAVIADNAVITEDAAVKTADQGMMNEALAGSADGADDILMSENVEEKAETQQYSKELIRGWFDGTSEPEMDWDAEPVWSEDGELFYLPVADKNIYDLEEFLAQYFDDDEVEELLNTTIGGYAPFMEIDGVLYRGAGMVGN